MKVLALAIVTTIVYVLLPHAVQVQVADTQPTKTEEVKVVAEQPKLAKHINSWQDNPNGCDTNSQYIAKEPPHYCIDKEVKVFEPKGSNEKLGKKIAKDKYNWYNEQWSCLYKLWTKESNWNNHAQNPTSTAYGIAQFLDGTWASTGYTKTSDPEIQIKAGLKYIKNRYGTPCNAWNFSVNYGWY